MSGFYGYLKGVQNELADKYLPNIAPRNDSLAGPQGRKSDQVDTDLSSLPSLKNNLISLARHKTWKTWPHTPDRRTCSLDAKAFGRS